MPRATKDGLSEAEARSTINSVYAHEAREPIGSANSAHGPNGATPFQRKKSKVETDEPKAPPKAQPLPDPIPDGFRVLLESAFKEGEQIGISDTTPNANGEHKPGPGDVRTREKWLEKIDQKPISEIYPNHCEGLFIRINPLKARGKTDADVTSLRHLLVEFDLDQKGNRIPKEIQYGALIESGLPFSAILDSGDKSIHGWVRLDAPNRKEYDWRREMIWDYFKAWNLDPQNKNPSRYSRCPSVERNLYDKEGTLIGVGRQTLLAVNVGAKSWDEWEATQNQCTEEDLREFEKVHSERYRFRDRPFPTPMHNDAFYGVAGQIVRDHSSQK
jgi:hypothetical protein